MTRVYSVLAKSNSQWKEMYHKKDGESLFHKLWLYSVLARSSSQWKEMYQNKDGESLFYKQSYNEAIILLEI